MIHVCSNYTDDSWTTFKFIIKSHFQAAVGSMAKRQRPHVPSQQTWKGQGSLVNDAVGASERLTVSWKSRPVNKATRPAELCQWLRGGGCDSKPQVNHAHIHTHMHARRLVLTLLLCLVSFSHSLLTRISIKRARGHTKWCCFKSFPC